MDFKLNSQAFSCSVSALDCAVEQSVEMDYILPDYFPDIFRVLKCDVIPKISSHTISAGKLAMDICVTIRVLYVGNDSKRINCVEQQLNFSKSCELSSSCINPVAYINPVKDYMNCRVVNQRRLDVRGAVSIKVNVIGERGESFLADAFGGGIQLKHETIEYPVKRLCASKRVTVIEEMSVGGSKPPVKQVIRNSCNICNVENRIISGKLVVNGDAQISLLYLSDNDNATDQKIENLKFNIPFKQIIDIEGIDENFAVDLSVNHISSDFSSKNSDGDLECELIILVNCIATKYCSIEAVSDAFSTVYECELSKCDTLPSCKPALLSDKIMVKNALKSNDEKIANVLDMWCEITRISDVRDDSEESPCIMGNVTFNLLCIDAAGSPVLLENSVPFEHKLKVDNLKNAKLSPNVKIANVSYHISDDNTVDGVCELEINTVVSNECKVPLVKNITIKEDCPKDKTSGSAIKIYFACAGEDIWDIARRYSASVKSILDENEITSANLEDRQMLLIPLSE